MIKRTFWILLVGVLGLLAYDYASSPVFWKRMMDTFSSSGKGAYSEVFEPRELVPGNPGAAPVAVADPSQRTIDEAALDDLVAYAQYYDSFSLVVIHRGEVQLEWYRDDYDAGKLTQSQSMHKSLQALLVGIAIEEGLIASVNDPVGKYLPELRGDARGDITIEQLLRMTSGLENFEPSFNPWGKAFRWLYADNTRAATLAFLVGYLLREMFGIGSV